MKLDLPALLLCALLCGCAGSTVEPRVFAPGDGPFDLNSGTAWNFIPLPNERGAFKLMENPFVLQLRPGEEPITLIDVQLHSPQNLQLAGAVLLLDSSKITRDDFFVPFPPASLQTFDVKGALVTSDSPVFLLLNVETTGIGQSSHGGIEISFERSGIRSIAILSQWELHICEGEVACAQTTSTTEKA